VVDDLTVTFTFTEPQPYPYGAGFVGYASPVISRAQFADCVGEQASACTDQNFMPVGTGPYMVTDLRPEDTVAYAFNPNYRGVPEGKPFFGTVTIKGGGDAESAARSVLEIGEADYGWNLQVAPEVLLPMEDAGNGRIITSFTANVEHINLNQTDPDGDPPSEFPSQHPVLYQNAEFARALSLAIDRDALVAVGYGPTGVPTCTIWPVGDQATTALDECLTRDVDTANQILDDLGYLDTDNDGTREAPGFGPLVFDFVTSTNAVRQSNQDIIKSNWEEIGVVANMSNQDASLFFDGTSASDFSIWKFFSDMEMFTNGSVLPDAAGYLHGYHTDEMTTGALGWPANNNIVRFSDATYDEISDGALSLSPTDPEYVDLVKQMQEIVVNQGAIINLIHRGNVSAIAVDIEGFGEPNGWDSEYWNVEDWFRSEG
jgi:peptide/nickel transport system substrate-binding protein